MATNKWTKNIAYTALTVSLMSVPFTFLAGCSGGSNDTEKPTLPSPENETDDDTDNDTAKHPAFPADTPDTLSPTHKPTFVGILVDSPVANVHYRGSVSSGTTTADGKFNFTPGESLTFSIGDTVFDIVTGTTTVTAFELAKTLDTSNNKLINTARFIQSLDIDAAPENGISISDDAHVAATGIKLNFSDMDFDSVANPVVANSGSVNSALIDGNTAIANLQNSINSLAPVIPIAGNYMTGSGDSLEALYLFEDGRWLHVMAFCPDTSQPAYEFGTYSYNDATGVLALTANINPDVCGFNSGIQTIVNAPLTQPVVTFTINGQGWTSYRPLASQVTGSYFIFSDSDQLPRTWSFDPAGNFISLGGVPNEPPTCILSGTSNGVREQLSFVRNSHSTCSDPTQNPDLIVTVEVEYSDYGIFPVDLNIYSVDGDPVDEYFSVMEPSTRGGSLTGIWSSNAGESVIFTPDGHILASSASSVSSLGGNGLEQGRFSWNSQSQDVVVDIVRDDDLDSSLGLAALHNGVNSAISKLEPVGNLLQVTSNGKSQSWIKSANRDTTSIQGVWNRELAGSGPKTFMLTQTDILPTTYFLFVMEDDCPASTGTAEMGLIEGYDGNTGAFTFDQDNPGCGLPSSTTSVSFSLSGDILNAGWGGTYYRIR